jgi:hypothetical protein
MSLIRVKIPFYRRRTPGNTNGLATLFLGGEPNHIPELNQSVIITHTDIPTNSGLRSKLDSLSTNSIPAVFQSYEENNDAAQALANDNFTNFFIIQYEDTSLSSVVNSGDCKGYIEFDIPASTYQVMKPIETAAVVTETIPYDGNTGNNSIYANTLDVSSGETIMPAMFIRRQNVSSVFSNVLTGLNLPVSEEEMMKYTRSDYGLLTEAANGSIIYNGKKYNWAELSADNVNGVLNPVDGYAGECYNTALQTIGSLDMTYAGLTKPVTNDLYLVFEIPSNQYGEIIDGKSIKMGLPYWNGSSWEEIELYGTYNNSKLNDYKLDNILSEKDPSAQCVGQPVDLTKDISEYESNVTFLFTDKIKRPGNSLSSDVEWSDGYEEFIDGQNVFNPKNQKKYTYDHRIDTCVGVAYLDKGFIVITHQDIVNNLFENVMGGTVTFDTGTTSNFTYEFPTGTTSQFLVGPNGGLETQTGTTMTVTLDDLGNVDWESTQFIFRSGVSGIPANIKPYLTYTSYNTEKTLNIVCIASVDEFFKSSNPTAKELLTPDDTNDFTSFKSEDSTLYPVLITEIGIHDAEGNLLAICKPTRPIPKYWYDVQTFAIKIRL